MIFILLRRPTFILSNAFLKQFNKFKRKTVSLKFIIWWCSPWLHVVWTWASVYFLGQDWAKSHSCGALRDMRTRGQQRVLAPQRSRRWWALGLWNWGQKGAGLTPKAQSGIPGAGGHSRVRDPGFFCLVSSMGSVPKSSHGQNGRSRTFILTTTNFMLGLGYRNKYHVIPALTDPVSW